MKSMDVDCPRCDAIKGNWCRDLRSFDPKAPEFWVTRFNHHPHKERIRRARESQQQESRQQQGPPAQP